MTNLPVSVTSLYAAILAVIFCWLCMGVIKIRRREQISLLDGGREDLTRAIRAQGNFAEYVPFALLLMMLLELNGGPKIFLHGLGIGLIASRLSHAYAISRGDTGRPRVLGMVGTFAAIVLAAVGLLARVLFAA